jgi:hypothetical protein
MKRDSFLQEEMPRQRLIDKLESTRIIFTKDSKYYHGEVIATGNGFLRVQVGKNNIYLIRREQIYAYVASSWTGEELDVAKALTDLPHVPVAVPVLPPPPKVTPKLVASPSFRLQYPPATSSTTTTLKTMSASFTHSLISSGYTDWGKPVIQCQCIDCQPFQR